MISISDECSKLPSSLQHLKIEIPLPVVYSTEVKVGCNNGYTLLGDSVITCYEGGQFTFTQFPSCQIGDVRKQYLYLYNDNFIIGVGGILYVLLCYDILISYLMLLMLSEASLYGKIFHHPNCTTIILTWVHTFTHLSHFY